MFWLQTEDYVTNTSVLFQNVYENTMEMFVHSAIVNFSTAISGMFTSLKLNTKALKDYVLKSKT